MSESNNNQKHFGTHDSDHWTKIDLNHVSKTSLYVSNDKATIPHGLKLIPNFISNEKALTLMQYIDENESKWFF